MIAEAKDIYIHARSGFHGLVKLANHHVKIGHRWQPLAAEFRNLPRSFGHAAFFGGGAYAAALLVKYAGTPMELNLLLAPPAAAILAIVIGFMTYAALWILGMPNAGGLAVLAAFTMVFFGFASGTLARGVS